MTCGGRSPGAPPSAVSEAVDVGVLTLLAVVGVVTSIAIGVDGAGATGSSGVVAIVETAVVVGDAVGDVEDGAVDGAGERASGAEDSWVGFSESIFGVDARAVLPSAWGPFF